MAKARTAGKARKTRTRASANSRRRTAYETVTFPSWDAFKHGVRDALPGSHDYDVYKRFIFRGQGSAAWPLTSTFDRNYALIQAAKRESLARKLIQEFFDECERFSPWRYKVEDARVLAMAQHHGLPTRLLDWSYSPYVAAYFAFSWFMFERFKEKEKGSNVAIWVLDKDQVERRAPTGQLEIITVQDYENNRLGSQFGVFTYLKTDESDLADYLTKPTVNLGRALKKLQIPKSEARPALQDLILMGIHHGTIFPGREGIANTIKLLNLLKTS
jgi:hypothetical protein